MKHSGAAFKKEKERCCIDDLLRDTATLIQKKKAADGNKKLPVGDRVFGRQGRRCVVDLFGRTASGSRLTAKGKNSQSASGARS